MKDFNHYLELVNKRIGEIHYPESPRGLYEPIAYTMSLGGKRLRPVLVLMTCHALGGDYLEAVTSAVGLEMFHNFTLLHDDVMDHADVRRGKPTVHERWNDNTAILSGDAMLTMAGRMVAKVHHRSRSAIMRVYNDTAMEVYEGQQYDMDFESRNDVTVDEYIEMIRLKTSVLLGCACKMGAILANAPLNDAEAMYRVGVNLGLAFQLKDDVLDVWGDPKTFGKEIGGDIMNNKKTFLLASALATRDSADRRELVEWLRNPNPDRREKVEAVTGIYERLKLREKAEAEIRRYSQLAVAELAHVDFIDKDARVTFAKMIEKLVGRIK